MEDVLVVSTKQRLFAGGSEDPRDQTVPRAEVERGGRRPRLIFQHFIYQTLFQNRCWLLKKSF